MQCSELARRRVCVGVMEVHSHEATSQPGGREVWRIESLTYFVFLLRLTIF